MLEKVLMPYTEMKATFFKIFILTLYVRSGN